MDKYEQKRRQRRLAKKMRYRKDSDAVLKTRILESEERAAICREVLRERGV